MSDTRILLPVGRLIMGSVYRPNDRDTEGRPLMIKNGPNAGQPRVDFFMAVAIPKTPGHTHWAQTDWGATIYSVGASAFPAQHQAATFAWKVEDGDSTIPNAQGKRPCDREGAKGHWVVRLGGGYAPRLFVRNPGGDYAQIASGAEVPPSEQIVKLGHYVQCQITVEGNGSSQRPGLYLNHGMTLHAGYGPEIIVGPDAASVFGAGPAGLPSGASATPVGVTTMPVAAVSMPPQPAPAAAVVPPVVVTPHPAIMAPVLPPPPVVAPPPAPAARQMTPKAAGVPYDEFIRQGWTDALLIQHGYMVG